MKSKVKQRGAVLIVALVMLVLITLTGVSTASLIRDNSRVLQNFETRAAVRNAAISALQQAIARGTLVSTGTVFTSPCTTARTVCIDADGDGSTVAGQDIEVTIGTLRCVSATILRNDELNVFTSAEDASCYQPQQIFSLCAEAVWDVEATAVDPVTGASSTVRQGLSTRTPANTVSSACSS